MENDKQNYELIRKRKECYRNLLNRVEELQESEDQGIRAIKEVGSILEKINSLENDEDNTPDHIEKNPDETMLDSMVLSSASNFLVKCVKAVNVTTSIYDAGEFSSKLINRLKDQDGFRAENLMQLLNVANTIVPKLHQFSFVHGTFEPNVIPEAKQKRASQRQKPEQVEKKQLQRVTELDKEEKDVSETVNILLKLLQDEYKRNGQRPVKYYEFIVDSESFENTVENMFYFSFLLRDGKAALQIDENNEAIVVPISQRQLDEFRQNNGENTQMICSLDMEEWKKLAVKRGIVQKYKKM